MSSIKSKLLMSVDMFTTQYQYDDTCIVALLPIILNMIAVRSQDHTACNSMNQCQWTHAVP